MSPNKIPSPFEPPLGFGKNALVPEPQFEVCITLSPLIPFTVICFDVLLFGVSVKTGWE